MFHWRVPSTMLACLAASVALALGHHFFYQHLDGEPLGSAVLDVVGFHMSAQQINTSVGLVFAVLVRACLTTAVSVAYGQVFWCAIMGKNVKMSDLNTAFSPLGNALMALWVPTWWRFPVLFALALVAWLIPAAIVLPPAALTIVPKVFTTASMRSVQDLNFTSMNFVGSMTPSWSVSLDLEQETRLLPDSPPTYYGYAGPHYALKQISIATAAQGSILPIPAPATNTSWTIAFAGPSVQCTDVSGDARVAIERNILGSTVCYPPGGAPRYAYLAWTPVMGDILPFDINTTSPRSGSLGPLQGMANFQSDGVPASEDRNYTILTNDSAPATLYVTVVPGIADLADVWNSQPNNGECWNMLNGTYPMMKFIADAMMLQCQLYNSTYELGFDYTNNVQFIAVNNITIFNEQPIPAFDGAFGQATTDSCPVMSKTGYACGIDFDIMRNLAYQSIMDAFGQSVVGSISSGTPGSSFAALSRSRSPDIDRRTPLSMANSSTSGAGSLGLSLGPGLQTFAVTGSDSIVSINTLMTSTALFGLPDLAKVRQWVMGTNDLKGLLLHSNSSNATSPGNLTATVAPIPLKVALEQMFSNITIGLLSSPYLRPHGAASPATIERNVTSSSTQIVYLYAPAKLWLAYGLAIGFSALSVAVGMFMLFAHDASYSSDFSTILRTTRQAMLSTKMQESDFAGGDPLPKHLTKATITIGAVGGSVGVGGKKGGYKVVTSEFI